MTISASVARVRLTLPSATSGGAFERAGRGTSPAHSPDERKRERAHLRKKQRQNDRKTDTTREGKTPEGKESLFLALRKKLCHVSFSAGSCFMNQFANRAYCDL